MPKKKQAHTNTGGGKQKSQAATAQPHKDDATCKARRAGTESTTETGELGILARMLPDIPIPHLEIPALPADTPKPESKPPQVFFADDPRKVWVTEYIIGDVEAVVRTVNRLINGKHLPVDFSQDNLLKLVWGVLPWKYSPWTPYAIVTAANKYRGGSSGKKRVPSADVQKLRNELYTARQKAQKDADKKNPGKGKYTVEYWETWIKKFVKRLESSKKLQELLDIEVRFTNLTGTKKVRNFDTDDWKALYKQEVQGGKKKREAAERKKRGRKLGRK